MNNVPDLTPDPRFPGPADVLARNVRFKSVLSNIHTTLAVSNTLTQTCPAALRIKRVRVGTVAGGTITVQIQVNGRDIFDDVERPVSGAEEKPPTDLYTIPAGALIASIIEATTGAPTGSGAVDLFVDPFTILPRTPRRELRGRDRLRVSKRRDIQAVNAGVDVSSLFPVAFTVPFPVGPRPERDVRKLRIRGEDVYFRPRRPR